MLAAAVGRGQHEEGLLGTASRGLDGGQARGLRDHEDVARRLALGLALRTQTSGTHISEW